MYSVSTFSVAKGKTGPELIITGLSSDGKRKNFVLTGLDAMDMHRTLNENKNPALRLIETPSGLRITYFVEDTPVPEIPEEYR